MAQIINVVIDEHGDSTVDLEGFHGVGCHAIQEAFQRAIGKQTESLKKPEYNRPCQTRITQGR